ncbi:uncharacterized protein LOC135484415 [Lineus longissimus]|uniref:uncharacterized protein LOC135484415 n=1 Tax=Lineus longissimus TaxID=88925 RepID=UPI00315D4A37
MAPTPEEVAADKLKRMVHERGSKRATMTRLINKMEDVVKELNAEAAVDTTLDVTKLDQVFAKLALVPTKLAEIVALDKDIIKATPTDTVDHAVTEAEDYTSNVEEKHIILKKIYDRLASPKQPKPATLARTPAPTNTSTTPTVPVTKNVHLPKLQLSTFSGNILEWTTFFDGFTAAIHNNNALGNVQKFQYLRAQLQGEASLAIAGLQLTDANYASAIELLRERYGQNHKLKAALMKALWDLPKPSDEIDNVKSFYDQLESHIRGLRAIGMEESSYGDLLVPLIMEKLPRRLRQLITRDHGARDWQLQEVREAIKREIDISIQGDAILDLCNDSNIGYATPTAAFSVNATRNTSMSEKKRAKCVFCSTDNHPSVHCKSVTDPKRRWEIVKRADLCFNCLGNHRAKFCNSTTKCHKCRRRHHTALCDSSRQASNRSSNPSSTAKPYNEREQAKTATTVHQKLVNTKPLMLGPAILKSAVATAKSPTRSTKVNIILDEGSQRSFITAKCASNLELKPQSREMIKIAPFGANAKAVRALDNVIVQIETASRVENVPMKMLIVPKISAPISTCPQAIFALPHLKNLKFAETSSGDFMEIDILIGADYYWSIVGDKIVRPAENTLGPVAVSSKFGYLLSGPTPANIEGQRDEYTPALLTTVLNVLASHTLEDKIAQSYWDLETIGIKDDTEEKESDFLLNYRDTCLERDDNGKYVARLPWLDNHPILPTNYHVAKARTRSMVRKLSPDLLSKYQDIITTQLQRHFIGRVANDNINIGHYLPHHAVLKDSSASTPIRVVYDASCKKSNDHPSLNDCLDPGPNCLNELNAILLRFRMHPIGLSSDIEKAFLNIRLNEEDRCFTKFLWLSDPSDPESDFHTYQFEAVLFGTVSSPFILQAVLHTHLDAATSSRIAADVKNNIYVDNVVTGVATTDTAMEYYNTANAIMSDCGFKLRAWTSNGATVRDQAQADDINETKTTVSVLGMKWDTGSDQLSYAKKAAPSPDILLTKRAVISHSSSIFDPLGYIAPMHIKAKAFLQELWQHGLHWHEPLTTELSERWRKITIELEEAMNITVPRKILDNIDPQNCELHAFSDASPAAYGCAIYLKSGTQASLLIAKTRVKPLKATTIPRMELIAALTGYRLAKYTLEALQGLIPIKKQVIWIDSQIVLHWITSDKKLPVFVQNRVNELRKFPGEFRYVQSKDNPADLLTRGITAQELRDSPLWWTGPSWLSTGMYPPTPTKLLHNVLLQQAATTDDVPDQVRDDTSDHAPDVRDQTHHPATTPLQHPGIAKVIDVTRFSSYRKLLRITALVQKIAKVWITKDKTNLKTLIQATAQETSAAETLWIKAIQTDCYHNEIEILKGKTATGPLAGRSKTLVNQLRLYLDESGLIRLDGRLNNARINLDTKFPYLVPRKHPFTDLLIGRAHAAQLHSGMRSTVAWLRQRFWIPRIREAVNSQLRRCVTCKLIIGKPYSKPETPPLQASRIQQAPPFTVSGCDFTGALNVRPKEGGPEAKFYLALFTCAITRAVHLEVVPDMTSQTFLNAFRRFCARRSTPSQMISDNGTTFIAAANEIKQLMQSPDIQAHMADQRCTWTFNPKRAPWWGGFFERMIGMTKMAIIKTLRRARVTLDELTTLVTQVEGILNDRPLTYIGDMDITAPLTPAHLLHGRQITGLPYEATDLDELADPNFGDSLNKRAKRLAVLIDHFWQQWSSEYIPSLRERHIRSKRGHRETRVKVGEIVLVHSDETKRVNWKIAKIERLIYGQDGIARAAQNKTSSGVTNRPIARLYPLEVTAAETAPIAAQVHEKHNEAQQNTTQQAPVNNRPPTRNASKNARNKIMQWANVLNGKDD